MKIILPQYITGEYAVGTECFTVVDHTRKEVLGPKEGMRRMTVRMYYPTYKDAVKEMNRGLLFSEKKQKILKKAFHIKNEDILQTECYEGAIHVDNRKFPLVVFSHGYNSYVEANTFLCCELASNGYVVASIGHAYEAAINEYDDGTYDLYDIKNNRRICNNFIRHFISQVKLLKSKGTPEELYKKFDAFQRENAKFLMERIHEWGKDVMCVIDTLKTKYVEWIDFSKGIGASGHSFGGATAYYLCQHSEEITCGINIDGGIFGDYEGMVMKKPFLQILGESYNTATKPLLDTEAPVKCEIFHDIKHSGFTDAKFFIQYKMIVGKMDACEMHRKLSSCHLQFFQKYIA